MCKYIYIYMQVHASRQNIYAWYVLHTHAHVFVISTYTLFSRKYHLIIFVSCTGLASGLHISPRLYSC